MRPVSQYADLHWIELRCRCE